MSLFQPSVLKKQINNLDNSIVEKAYKKYSKYFLNPEIQKNIRKSKEEQFQEGFLNELFDKVLGYTLNPKPKFNLTTELKNLKGAKKADGAILVDGKALAVIELKSTKVKDLESIRQQAFDYKSHHPTCVYVITSTFDRLRFYIDNSVDYEEFDLFGLDIERFKLMYLLLAEENLLNNVAKTIKDNSLIEEKKITKNLYADYSLFKREIYRDIVKRNFKNTELKELTDKGIKKALFQKTQKLMDRFLFIFFGEDRDLLPTNSISKIIKSWDSEANFDDKPLYELYKQYFHVLDIGRQKKGNREEIFAYNGGLFKPDAILDSLIINDELLREHTLKLSSYNFDTDVDVNILGHIFENSLNEIESINAEIDGAEFDEQKTKRKKDGVFYTPKYITKYIIENTVGKLCIEKKIELEINEEVYFYAKQRSRKRIENLDKYRRWLLELTIVDPACGSGAFLNQALDFLIKEHAYIDELTAKYHRVPLVLSDIENHILENNIFGVDINDESVEIAQLSLWLRTAQKGRKLTSLNNNIKCGNSLIDSKKVAGDKAFNWHNEFPDIFAKGGFDVVIGNPPYVRQELLGEFKPYFETHFDVFDNVGDLFSYFYEKSFSLLRENGKFGFISNTFDKTKASERLRTFLSSQTKFINYVDFTEVQIFEGATTYPIIIIAENSFNNDSYFEYFKITKNKQAQVIDIELETPITVNQNSLEKESWSFHSLEKDSVIKKISIHKSIREQFSKCFYGIKTGFNEAFIIDMRTKENLEKEHASSSELIKPFYEGKDILKWRSPELEKYIIFSRRGTEIEKYPAIKKHLEKYKERLTPKKSPEIKIGRKKGSYKWFEIQDSVDYYQLFEGEKITWANLQSKNKFCLDTKGYYINAPSVILPSGNKTLLAILNSKLVWEFLKSICVVRSGGYIEVKPQYFEQIPIPELKNEDIFEEKVNNTIDNTSKLQSIDSRFTKYLQSQFSIEKLSKKLQKWHELEFSEFIKELNKAIKKSGGEKLSKSDEMDWMDVFETKKAEAQKLKAEIDKTDKEIDQMVYNLYGLSEEEIRIVEESL